MVSNGSNSLTTTTLLPALLRASLGHPLRVHPASDLAGQAAGACAAGAALDLPLANRLRGLQWHQG